ncbi:MAG TPA: hypothetical protein VKN74_08185 [Candidatus Mcinerneyibacterium sp.]|nr:hypothetical protein [Candidatus Mcinerneyibacterium sp.]
MKKVLILLLTVAVLFTAAYGTDFSWKGEIRARTSNDTNIAPEDFQNAESIMDTRVRLYTTATMSENLKAVVGLEIGDFEWGNDDHNADYENVEVKNAYLEFTPEMMEMLTFRVGLQTYVDQFGSAVFDEDAAGIMMMPEFEGFNMNAGLFVLEDDDVETDSHTFGIIDMTKDMDALSLKGSLYYDTVRDEYSRIYFGAGADYDMNDSLGMGGHFLYMSWKQDSDIGDAEAKGYFAYLYGEYTMDKFNAKVNFGYTPSEDAISDDATAFAGIEPYPYLYGLEYFFPGDVYDGKSQQWDYGGYGLPTGSMVVSANLSYDFLFANIGLINTTAEEIDDNALGTEIDLGIDYELTEGLNFKAVYAIFMPGDSFGDDYENGTELSTQLKYKF